MTTSKIIQNEFELNPEVVGCLQEEEVNEILHQKEECTQKRVLEEKSLQKDAQEVEDMETSEEIFLDEGCMQIEKNKCMLPVEEPTQEVQEMFLEDGWTEEGKGQEMLHGEENFRKGETQDENTIDKISEVGDCMQYVLQKIINEEQECTEDVQYMPLDEDDIQNNLGNKVNIP
ncbi:unnamed protein product, partial [Meganyctiphanes norvegica]